MNSITSFCEEGFGAAGHQSAKYTSKVHSAQASQ